MTPSDLEPAKVDGYPVMDFATREPEIDVYEYVPGLKLKLSRFFAYAKDTNGNTWLVHKRKAGIFKSLPGKERQAHQQRVIDEKRDLDERLNKLKAFFGVGRFKELDCDERSRMRKQAHIMAKYSKILGERIVAFKVERKES